MWNLSSPKVFRHLHPKLYKMLARLSGYFGDSQVGTKLSICNSFSYALHMPFLDDSLLPGFHLRVPMMIVLDTLKSDDPQLRRVGETWMRCSLKSYLRCVL